MTVKVLIIGGYGNFGQYITKKLSRESNLQLILAGRDKNKAQELVDATNAANKIETAYIDINEGFPTALTEIKPNIVIHTSGPYQDQGYGVAEACIVYGCHYIDLADARMFVSGITKLNDAAKKNKVLVASGCSSVPTLTSAIVDKYFTQFEALEEIDYAITSAQRTNQGLATTNAILSYVGKPFRTIRDGRSKTVYGWQDLRIRKFWKLNFRTLGNCDVPDLEIFPSRYPSLKSIRFQAGIESKIQHIGLFLLSWLVRIKLLKSLRPFAKHLLRISRSFDIFGSNDSGFYMTLIGLGANEESKKVEFQISARSGDGLYIPCIPAILMARKLAYSELSVRGAFPCVGFISLEEYLKELSDLEIEWMETSS